MKSFSIIIPVKDMGAYLMELLESIVEVGLLKSAHEIIIVNDASIDETAVNAEKFKQRFPEKIFIITHAQNQGRYHSREEAARRSTAHDLLFIDARVTLPFGFTEQLLHLSQKHGALMGVPNYSERSAFSLYWKITHEFIFKKNSEDARKGFYLNEHNFDEYVKGTGLLYCSKEVFLSACGALSGKLVLSDDNDLLKEIVKLSPLFVCDQLNFHWEPRQNYGDFLHRLWERGPSFVDHHVLENQTRFAFFFLIYNLIFLTVLILLALSPKVGSILALFCVLAVLLSVLVFERRPERVFKIAPLHFLSFLAFFTGAQYGFLSLLFKKILNPLKRKGP